MAQRPHVKIIWAPQNGPQHALVECPVFEIFYGGARGGGKTDGMLGKWAIKADKWGLILDYGFMDLSGQAAVGQNGVLAASVRQGALEAFAVRRFARGNNTLDVYGGIRWWDNDIGATVDLMVLPGTPSPKVEEDWVDPVLGARWRHPFSEKWDVMLRADVGGFGVASDFTSAFGASIFWKFKPKFALEAAYRATWVDFEDGTPQMPGYFAYDTVTHGPLVGFIFGF